MGGARPSLEAAIEAMLEGSRDRCLLCSGQVVRRSADGVLVCRVCESVLTESDTLDAVLLLDAA
jgi:ribosomal protein L37AE/L43A